MTCIGCDFLALDPDKLNCNCQTLENQVLYIIECILLFTSEFSSSISKHIGLTSSILSGRSTIEFIDESTNSGAILEKDL